MAKVWMHPPRDLRAELVEEEEVTLRQVLGWMHAEAPPQAAAIAETVAPRTEPDPKPGETEEDEHDDSESVDTNSDQLGHQPELGEKSRTRSKRKRG